MSVAQQRRADFLIRYLDAEGQERLLHVEFQNADSRRLIGIAARLVELASN